MRTLPAIKFRWNKIGTKEERQRRAQGKYRRAAPSSTSPSPPPLPNVTDDSPPGSPSAASPSSPSSSPSAMSAAAAAAAAAAAKPSTPPPSPPSSPGAIPKPRPRKRKRYQYFSPEEDALLTKLRSADKPELWRETARKFPGRNAKALQSRWFQLKHKTQIKGPFSSEERDIVVGFMATGLSGKNKNILIAQFVPKRTPTQIGTFVRTHGPNLSARVHPWTEPETRAWRHAVATVGQQCAQEQARSQSSGEQPSDSTVEAAVAAAAASALAVSAAGAAASSSSSSSTSSSSSSSAPAPIRSTTTPTAPTTPTTNPIPADLHRAQTFTAREWTRVAEELADAGVRRDIRRSAVDCMTKFYATLFEVQSLGVRTMHIADTYVPATASTPSPTMAAAAAANAAASSSSNSPLPAVAPLVTVGMRYNSWTEPELRRLVRAQLQHASQEELDNLIPGRTRVACVRKWHQVRARHPDWVDHERAKLGLQRPKSYPRVHDFGRVPEAHAAAHAAQVAAAVAAADEEDDDDDEEEDDDDDDDDDDHSHAHHDDDDDESSQPQLKRVRYEPQMHLHHHEPHPYTGFQFDPSTGEPQFMAQPWFSRSSKGDGGAS